MKTPMQEHIEWLKNEHKLIVKLGGENERLLIEECIKQAESMREKEKEVINDAYITGYGDRETYNQPEDDYYNETFKTNEE